MDCPQCNRVLREGALFCDVCGSSIAAAVESSEASTAPRQEGKEPDPLVGRTISAKYRLLSLLGSGGMGSVYRARRLLIGDDVAVKILHTEYVNEPKTVERFRREAQAAAMIRHPSVVAIYDFSEARDGEPAYIVMELVEGKSLRKILESEGRLGASRAVAIMREICKGVGAAHRLQVVHRDIKPDNIMILPRDSDDINEHVKVVDFGIAKLRDMAGDKKLTQTGRVIGTVYYMSPEQCCGEHLDARSDVYSLGAVLYEMLAGAPPFTAETGTAIVAKHLTEPPPPFAVEATVPARLEAVVMRSLGKDAETRQSDASALRKELEAAIGYHDASPATDFISGDISSTGIQPEEHASPAQAKSPVAKITEPKDTSPTEARRSIILRWSVVGVIATLIAVAAFMFTRRARIEKPLVDSQSHAITKENETIWAAVTTLQSASKVYAIAFSPDDQLLASASSEGLRGDQESISEIRLWSMSTGELRRTLTEHSEGVLSIAFSPDGNALAVATSSGTGKSKIGKIKLWDVQTGILKWAVNAHEDLATSICFSPDGQLVASGSWDRTVKLWDAQTGKLNKSLPHDDQVYAIAFSPEGTLLATAGQKSVSLWNVQSGEVKQLLSGDYYAVRAVAFSPDGRSVATGDVKSRVELWDAQSGSLKQTFDGHTDVVDAVTFSPDGQILVSGSYDTNVIFWNLKNMVQLKTLRGTERVTSVAFSHDGRTFASGGWDKAVRLWK